MVSLSENARDAIPPKEPLKDYEIAARDFAAMLADMGVTVECSFVPFSASRNKDEPRPSLNWRCRVLRNGKAVTGLESVDYGQGSGHCPAYKAGAKRYPVKADLQRAIAIECETGRRAMPSMSRGPYATSATISAPTAADIISALCRDADVLDYARFEDWASDLGFDPDSRKGEAIYRQCLAYGLALRAAIGNDKLQALRELANEM